MKYLLLGILLLGVAKMFDFNGIIYTFASQHGWAEFFCAK